MRGLGAAILAMVLAFSGCAAKTRPAGDAVLEDGVPAAPETIPLRVLVLNDEYLPVVGATVHIVGLGLNATTNDAGDAFFQVAKPGVYSVHTHSLGYYPNVTKVRIEGMAQVRRIWLRDAPRDGHFSDFYYYAAVCDAAVYAAPIKNDAECPSEPYMPRPTARWILAGGLQGGTIGLDWDPQPGGTDRMRLEVLFPEIGAFPDGRASLVSQGKAPVRVEIGPELITREHQRNGVVVEVRAGIPRDAAGASLHQPFHFEAQFDYFHPAPSVQDH